MFKLVLSFERQMSIVVFLLLASISGCSQTPSTNTPTKTAATQEAAPANAKIALNRRELGTTADTSALRNTLSEIIKNRHAQSVVKPGSTEIERTVYVKAAPSIGMTEVVKIIEIAKDAGASPVSVPIEIDIDKAGDLKPNPVTLL